MLLKLQIDLHPETRNKESDVCCPVESVPGPQIKVQDDAWKRETPKP